jgi:hypothetical protein
LRTLIDEQVTRAPGRYTLDSSYTGWGKPVNIGPPELAAVSQG